MTPSEFRQILQQTLADRRLSRTENRALAAALADAAVDPQQLVVFRSAAFEMAREAWNTGDAPHALLEWLEDVIGALAQAGAPAVPSESSEACFSPGDACVNRLRGLFRQAQSTADVCVFTITDDRISEVLLDAHGRGVAVRVLTDNEKAFDYGSDIERLRAAGVATRVDASEHHMHHKFAIFDRKVLVTGSYNWTRSAAEYNEENMLVTTDGRSLAQFQREFERLWDRCADFASSLRS